MTLRSLLLFVLVPLWAALGCTRGESSEGSRTIAPAVAALSHRDGTIAIDQHARAYAADPTSAITDATSATMTQRFAEPGMPIAALQARGGDQWWVLDLRNTTDHVAWMVSLRGQFPRADAWILTCDADHRSCAAPPGAVPMPNGFYVRPELRPATSMGYAFPLDVEQGGARRVVLRLYVAGREPLTAEVLARDRYQRHDQLLRLLIYLLIGGMIGSCFYTAFIYAWTRDSPYLWYATYALMSTGVWASYYSLTHFWVDGMRTNQAITGVAGVAALACALGFHASFLELQRVAPWLLRLVRIELVVAVAVLAIIPFTAVALYKPLAAAVGGVVIVTLLTTATYCAVQRERRARFLLVGWIPFLVTALLSALGVLGLVPIATGKEVIIVSHGFEMLSLSFALADRIKILGEERETARAQAVEELQLRLEASEHARRLEGERADAVAEAERQGKMARTDALTGLGNRLAFDREMRRFAIDPTPFRRHAVLVMDVDGLKQLNDRHGHSTGDEMLIAFAHSLREHLRRNDAIYRLGGDEFVVLVEDSVAPDADEVARRIRMAMNRIRETGGWDVGISVGIAYADEAPTPVEVLDLADRRMYDDKERDGRARSRNERESVSSMYPPAAPRS